MSDQRREAAKALNRSTMVRRAAIDQMRTHYTRKLAEEGSAFIVRLENEIIERMKRTPDEPTNEAEKQEVLILSLAMTSLQQMFFDIVDEVLGGDQ